MEGGEGGAGLSVRSQNLFKTTPRRSLSKDKHRFRAKPSPTRSRGHLWRLVSAHADAEETVGNPKLV